MTEAAYEDPLRALVDWHEEAVQRQAREPDAMTLATVDSEGQPSVRVVLFKGLEGTGIRFVSNYDSRKGRDIESNSAVALVFFWPELGRQLRVEGRARRASAASSDAYFRARPRESQLGAWASAQSQTIASRAELEQRFAAAEANFSGREVERPPGWGMYLVEPARIELWIAGAHRLHDRFLYVRANGAWSRTRLCP